MYERVLVATDGSLFAAKAVEHSATIARAMGAKLTIVTVTEQAPTFAAAEIGWSLPSSVYDDIRRANVERSRAILSAAASAAGTEVVTVHVENQRPADGIMQTASEMAADLIVVGSRGHGGIQQLLLGSQAAKILAMASCPVLVVK